MQSIIDKLQMPQSFNQSIAEFLIALGRTNDPANLACLEEPLQRVAKLTGIITGVLCLGILASPAYRYPLGIGHVSYIGFWVIQSELCNLSIRHTLIPCLKAHGSYFES